MLKMNVDNLSGEGLFIIASLGYNSRGCTNAKNGSKNLR